MILRKPYALLIKHFKKINMVLLALVLYLFYDTMKLHQFTKNYLSTTLYNVKIDSITRYANGYVYLALLLILVISGILIFLLRRKDKPFFSYVLILVINVITLVFLLYSSNYFNYKALDGFSIVTAKMLNDISFVVNILYYPLILILLIRSIGIDLKSFGFQEDKEFLEINESDREEIEVQANFDKHKWIRTLKYYFRNTKYFILENKLYVIIVLVIMALIGIRQFYRYYYIDNKIYKMNQVVSSNHYNLKVKNTYITDKDYSGNLISNKNDTSFILVDLEIGNQLNSDRNFDIEKMLLYIDKQYYVPTTKYNDRFKDMGNLYKGGEIPPKKTVSYVLVYEVPKPSEKANFILKYQDVLDTKLVKIKIKVVDISTFRDKGDSTYPNWYNIPLNENNTMKFKIDNYDINDSFKYTFKQCNSDGSCPIYNDTYTAPTGSTILKMKFDIENKEKKEFLDFIRNYSYIKYRINEIDNNISVKYPIGKNYQGNYVYLVVPSEIKDAKTIDLVFTVRTYKYIYHLKGE